MGNVGRGSILSSAKTIIVLQIEKRRNKHQLTRLPHEWHDVVWTILVFHLVIFHEQTRGLKRFVSKTARWELYPRQVETFFHIIWYTSVHEKSIYILVRYTSIWDLFSTLSGFKSAVLQITFSSFQCDIIYFCDKPTWSWNKTIRCKYLPEILEKSL